MPERSNEPPYKPPLRRYRLIRAGDAALPPETLTLSGAAAGLTAGSVVPLPPGVVEAQARLAEEAQRSVQEAQPTLDALPAALIALGASEETQQLFGLLCSILRALPDELAAGVESSVVHVDWMFARILNAPGQPGLIEQTMIALGASDDPTLVEQPAPALPAEYAPELEALRKLHRALVALQLGWDEMLNQAYPLDPVPETAPDQPQPASAGAAAPADGQGLPAHRTPPPLPAGLVVALPTSGARLAQPAPRYIGMRLRLAFMAAALLLVIASGGLLLLRSEHTPGAGSNSAAVVPPLPTQAPATATSQPNPTKTPRPQPTRRPRATSTPAPSPTSLPGSCSSSISLCPSTFLLQVPCSGHGSVTFQLTNTAAQKHNWSVISSAGSGGTPLVTITPASGWLKVGQTITLSVSANVRGQMLGGILIITDLTNNTQLMILLLVCG